MVGQISKIVTALVNRIVIWKHFYQVLWRSITPKALLPTQCWCLCEEFNSVSRSRNFSGKRCKYAGQSVRALPIRVITVGKKRSLGVQLVVDEYIGKLKYYCKVEDLQLRSNPKNTGDVKAQIKDEDMAVMNIISSDDWVVMLDENGLDIGSEQMAELMGDAGSTVRIAY